MGNKDIEYVKPDQLVIIGLDTDDGPTHPLYDERIYLPVDENLIRNISFYGIQQPVLVRREGETLYVVDGRQRTRAAREAANRQALAGEYQLLVPTREARGDDKRVMGIMISTNEQRQNDEVLAKALKAARMLDLCGDLDQVAVAFGRTKTTIRNWLSLAEADSAVHEALRSGQMSAQAAIEVSRYDRNDQREAVEKLTADVSGPVTGAAVTELRVLDGESSATKSHQAEAGATKATKKSATAQKGIKRMWLRKALKTDAADALTTEQRAVLNWFATGQASSADWFNDFRKSAEKELGDRDSGSMETEEQASPMETVEVSESEAVSEEDAINWNW